MLNRVRSDPIVPHLLINLLSNDPRPLLHRLRHAPSRLDPGLPRARRNRRRRPPRGVLRGAPPLRPAAPPGGVLPRRRGPVDPRPPRRALGRLRAAAALAALEPRRLRPLPRMGLRGGDDPERGLRREADVGVLRRLRQPRPQHPRLPRPAAGRAPPRRLPGPHLRPRRPRQQGAPGGLAVEGGADGDLARGPGHLDRGLGRGRRLAALPHLHRGAPAAAALPLPGDPSSARQGC